MIAVPIIATILVVEGIIFGVCVGIASDFADRPGSVRWWRRIGGWIGYTHLILLAIAGLLGIMLGLIFLWYWGTGNDPAKFFGP